LGVNLITIRGYRVTKRAKLRPATSLWHISLVERSPAEWIGTVDAAIAAVAELVKAKGCAEI
jgi:hypothetical protein